MSAGPFDEHQLLFVHRLAEALFDGFADMAIPIEQVVENFQTQFAMIGGTPVKKMGLILRLMPVALGPDFNDQTITTRRARIERRLIHGGIDILQDLARLKAVVYGAYYGHWIGTDQDDNRDNPVLEQIGFTLPKFRDRTTKGELPIDRLPGREIDDAHFVDSGTIPQDIDVIVIGSGSGGGVAARNLASPPHNYKVLVIEAGPHMPSPSITHEERLMGATLFKHGTLQATSDNDIIVFQGRNVGGSPTINNGICLRMWDDPLGNPFAPRPYEEWERLGAGIDKARFERAYDDVDAHLSLGQAEERSGRGNGKHLIEGWKNYAATRPEPWVRAAKPGWFRKNYGPPAIGQNPDTSCNYCGYCNTGCPYARKLAPAQTYLPQACCAGARILAETKVEQIVWAPREGRGEKRRAVGVLAKIGPGQVERIIPCKVGVVVAAGTIASSLLLKRSGIDGTGKDISLNVASPMIALMDPPVTPAWDEDQMTTAVDCGAFLLESHFQPPQSMAMLMPGWFGEMDWRMRHYGQLRSAGILIPIDRRGRLENGELKLKFKDADMALLREALGTLARVHFAAGAKEVWPALRVAEPLRPDDDIDAFFARWVEEKDDVTLSSAHPHGGNPINADPDKGVVDPKCRLHEAANVLVTDASVFPSSIRVNAHFSTMALAQYATGYGDPFSP
jgi:choline dehydrogenase-like flavoprotein